MAHLSYFVNKVPRPAACTRVVIEIGIAIEIAKANTHPDFDREVRRPCASSAIMIKFQVIGKESD